MKKATRKEWRRSEKQQEGNVLLWAWCRLYFLKKDGKSLSLSLSFPSWSPAGPALYLRSQHTVLRWEMKPVKRRFGSTPTIAARELLSSCVPYVLYATFNFINRSQEQQQQKTEGPHDRRKRVEERQTKNNFDRWKANRRLYCVPYDSRAAAAAVTAPAARYVHIAQRLYLAVCAYVMITDETLTAHARKSQRMLLWCTHAHQQEKRKERKQENMYLYIHTCSL